MHSKHILMQKVIIRHCAKFQTEPMVFTDMTVLVCQHCAKFQTEQMVLSDMTVLGARGTFKCTFIQRNLFKILLLIVLFGTPLNTVA